jgi:NAD(P)H-nitrite reductase large subunit
MKQFIIIGNSAAGIACIEAIRQKDKESKILVISDEDYPAYCRCLISYYLAGEIKEEKLIYRIQDFYQKNNAELLLNKKVERVDPKKNRVILEDKTSLNYDSLLIATGASPKFPQLPGIKKRNVFGFRTVKDAKEIDGQIAVAHTACVLGGGLIGLKCAYALKKRKLDVKLIVKSKQILSQMLDAAAANIVQKRLEENGLEVLLGVDVAEIIGNGDIKAIKLDSGKVIGCSVVVVGKGVKPNIDLIQDTSIEVNEGIRVNDYLQTNIPNIYAAGDVCESFDLTLNAQAVNALWPVAVEQGKFAGFNMVGENLKYDGSMGMNSIEFFGLPVVSLGIYKIKEENGFKEITDSDPKSNCYKKLILKDNRLLGAILVGEIKNSGLFLRLIREKIDLTSIKDILLKTTFSYADIMDLVKEKERIYV